MEKLQDLCKSVAQKYEGAEHQSPEIQERRPNQWKTDHKHGAHPPPHSQTSPLQLNDQHLTLNPNSEASKAQHKTLSEWLLKTVNYTKDILNDVIKIDNDVTVQFLDDGHRILAKMDDVDK